MTNLTNHPGMWLGPTAAASLERMEHDHGVIPITSAGRTVGEQQALIDRWFKGGPANRPPYLFKPYMPAEGGNHVRNGGQAFDTPAFDTVERFANAYGWYRLYAYDSVHFEYIESRDKMKNRTGARTPAGKTLFKDDDMIMLQNVANGGIGLLTDALGIVGLSSTDVKAYRDAGVKTISVTGEHYANLQKVSPLYMK